jgi:UDP-glucuronate 4-epimerase
MTVRKPFLPNSQAFLSAMKVLVTGAAGFIGMYVAQRLAQRGDTVVGIDNMNDYYAVRLKQDRLKVLEASAGFSFVHRDIADADALSRLFAGEKFDCVVHLAAQAGVRYSLSNPAAYIQSNLVGFGNMLESCRHHAVKHLVYASSSSVYGENAKMPFSEGDCVDHPLSLYAATKKSNELMAHSYSHLYRLPTTGLRFFTVYGPWGRPDMSPILFATAIMKNEPIRVFNHGQMQRDFTYIDDIVEGVIRAVDQPAQPDPVFDRTKPNPATSNAPYRIYNIGNHQPVALLTFIDTLEKALGKTAVKEMLPMQPGDVPATYADIEALQKAVGFAPNTSLDIGLARFADWFRTYYTPTFL